MASKINWDNFNKQQSVTRQGHEYAYDELPPAGSFKDRERYFSTDREYITVTNQKTVINKNKNIDKSDCVKGYTNKLTALIKKTKSLNWNKLERQAQINILHEMHVLNKKIIDLHMEKENSALVVDVAKILKHSIYNHQEYEAKNKLKRQEKHEQRLKELKERKKVKEEIKRSRIKNAEKQRINNANDNKKNLSNTSSNKNPILESQKFPEKNKPKKIEIIYKEKGNKRIKNEP